MSFHRYPNLLLLCKVLLDYGHFMNLEFVALCMAAEAEIYSIHDVMRVSCPVAGLWCVYLLQLITGWMLAFLFQVAHVVGEVEFPTPDESSGTAKVDGGWAALQVIRISMFPLELQVNHLTNVGCNQRGSN